MPIRYRIPSGASAPAQVFDRESGMLVSTTADQLHWDGESMASPFAAADCIRLRSALRHTANA